jgi:hypothetical protein
MLWALLLLLFTQPFGLYKPASPAASAPNAPRWSNKGTTFFFDCEIFKSCHPLRIASPDGKSAVEVTYPEIAAYPDDLHVLSLEVTTLGKSVGSVPPLEEAVQEEIVWSPDSKCFFRNSSYNSYVDEIVDIHCLDEPDLGPGHITQQAQRDMARSFPPCKATYLSDTECAQMEADPSYLSVVGLDWIHGSSEIVVMAEVPCDTMWGGIMCQVLGYEIAVPSGKILRRMEPKEFAKRWQHSMAWKFRIPPPPEYKKH